MARTTNKQLQEAWVRLIDFFRRVFRLFRSKSSSPKVPDSLHSSYSRSKRLREMFGTKP